MNDQTGNAPSTSSPEPTIALCADRPAMLKVSCDLPAGHTGKHSAEGGTIQWESVAAKLTRQLDVVRDIALEAADRECSRHGHSETEMVDDCVGCTMYRKMEAAGV